MKKKLMKNKTIYSKNFHGRCLYPKLPNISMLRVVKSYVPFTRKFPMVMGFVLLFHQSCVATLSVKITLNVKNFTLRVND